MKRTKIFLVLVSFFLFFTVFTGCPQSVKNYTVFYSSTSDYSAYSLWKISTEEEDVSGESAYFSMASSGIGQAVVIGDYLCFANSYSFSEGNVYFLHKSNVSDYEIIDFGTDFPKGIAYYAGYIYIANGQGNSVKRIKVYSPERFSGSDFLSIDSLTVDPQFLIATPENPYYFKVLNGFLYLTVQDYNNSYADSSLLLLSISGTGAIQNTFSLVSGNNGKNPFDVTADGDIIYVGCNGDYANSGSIEIINGNDTDHYEFNQGGYSQVKNIVSIEAGIYLRASDGGWPETSKIFKVNADNSFSEIDTGLTNHYALYQYDGHLFIIGTDGAGTYCQVYDGTFSLISQTEINGTVTSDLQILAVE